MNQRKNQVRRAIALLAVLTAAACRSEQAVGGEERAARVGELLYVLNLIADSNVSAKMMAYSTAVDGRGVPADSVLPELHAWLEAWAAAHPEAVARARLMPPAVERRSYVPRSSSAPGPGFGHRIDEEGVEFKSCATKYRCKSPSFNTLRGRTAQRAGQQ